MATDQAKTLGALQTSAQMEIDGKKYYLKASGESGNELGQRLLQSLAKEEDLHRQKFEEIYDAIRSKQAWPSVDFKPDRGKRLRTIFAEASPKMEAKTKAPATELDAIQTAMEMENKTRDFYTERSRKAAYAAEREFYKMLAAEESAHHLALLDYYEYLKEPAGWFLHKEHPSLDGA